MTSLLTNEGLFGHLCSEALMLNSHNQKVSSAESTRDKYKASLLASLAKTFVKLIPEEDLVLLLKTPVRCVDKMIPLIDYIISSSFNVSKMALETTDVVVGAFSLVFNQSEIEFKEKVDRINKFLTPATRLGFVYYSGTNNAMFSLRF